MELNDFVVVKSIKELFCCDMSPICWSVTLFLVEMFWHLLGFIVHVKLWSV